MIMLGLACFCSSDIQLWARANDSCTCTQAVKLPMTKVIWSISGISYSLLIFARWQHQHAIPCLGWVWPQTSPCLGGERWIPPMSLDHKSMLAKWHVNLSTSLSRMHKCDRPHYGEMHRNNRNRLCARCNHASWYKKSPANAKGTHESSVHLKARCKQNLESTIPVIDIKYL